MKGVNVERRSLELGDVAWVAKRKGIYNQTHTEFSMVVLDFIVERKRLDDLVSSLTDGRFHEQKVFISISFIVCFSYPGPIVSSQEKWYFQRLLHHRDFQKGSRRVCERI